MNKKVLIVIIALSLLLIAFGGVYAYHLSSNDKQQNEQTDKKKKKTSNEEPGVNFSKDKVELDKESLMAKQLEVLNTYAEKIYESKDYEQFGKKRNMYFISLNELHEKYGYDVSQFKGDDGKECNKEESGIYFDIDNTLKLDLSDGFKPILPTLVECTYQDTGTNQDGSISRQQS